MPTTAYRKTSTGTKLTKQEVVAANTLCALAAQGKSCRHTDVAKELGLQEITIRHTIANVMYKTGFTDRFNFIQAWKCPIFQLGLKASGLVVLCLMFAGCFPIHMQAKLNKNKHSVDLTWAGTPPFSVYRELSTAKKFNLKVYNLTAQVWTDNSVESGKIYNYEVCVTDTELCSNIVQVTIP